MDPNFLQRIESAVANFLPGWKTLTMAGGLLATNLPDLLQRVMEHAPDVISFIPEPYKTVLNVVLPLLMMWTTNIRERVANREEATPDVAQ